MSRFGGQNESGEDDLFGDAFKPVNSPRSQHDLASNLSPHDNCDDDNDDELLFVGETLRGHDRFLKVPNSPVAKPNSHSVSMVGAMTPRIDDDDDPSSIFSGIRTSIAATSIKVDDDDDDEMDEDDLDVIFQGSSASKAKIDSKDQQSGNPSLPTLPPLTKIHSASENFLNAVSSSQGFTTNFLSRTVPSMGEEHLASKSGRVGTPSPSLQEPFPPTIGRPLDEDDDEDDDNNKRLSTFSEYKPMKFHHGKAHPDQVVETSSMAVVEPPDIHYNLWILDDMMDSSSLSALQLEAVVYACQRHECFLESGERAAFFIGDGPGVGKGRIVAGIIHENKLHGREKAIWLSVSSDLRFDAIRDLTDVSCSVKVVPANKLSYNENIGDYDGYAEDAVVFSTYSTLIGSNSSGTSLFNNRIDQLVDWFGSDYDGVLVFDECHKAKNLLPTAGGKPTKTAVAVLELQRRLPQARVVYCSATGATEPKNLAYMYRLGLWGLGTPFKEFSDFLRAVEKRGVGGMEIVAMDMKLRGMYIARQLSFSGVSFRVSQVRLSDSFKQVYNRSVALWFKILNYSEKAATMCCLSGKANAFFWAKFWSYHQRFFKYLCIASKVDAVIELTKKSLEDGNCVVIGLQSTGESHISENDIDLDRIVSTACNVLRALVGRSFPVPYDGNDNKNANISNHRQPFMEQRRTLKRSSRAMEEEDGDNEYFIDEDDNNIEDTDSDVIILDDNYHPHKSSNFNNKTESINMMQSSEALAAAGLSTCKFSWGTPSRLSNTTAKENLTMSNEQICTRWREELLEDIELLGNDLPPNTLDELIDKLGGVDCVAEMTGRKGRIVKNNHNSNLYSYCLRSNDELPLEYVNIQERSQFMCGEKLVAIISEAASAGISLQADRRSVNVRKRIHITLELPWSADKAVQQFGRTHRSNQLHPPEYVFVISELAGEKRFASSVAKRLESLGALTHGDRRSSETRDLSRFNFENRHGRLALQVMLNTLKNISFLPTPVPFPPYEGNFVNEALSALESIGLANLLRSSSNSGDAFSAHSSNSADGRKSTNKISRFLNRLLGIKVDLQNAIFSFYTSILVGIIKEEKKAGKWDSGILDWGITGEKANIVDSSKFTIHSKVSDSVVELIQVSIERGINWEEAVERFNSTSIVEGDGFYCVKNFKNQPCVVLIKHVENQNSSRSGQRSNTETPQLFSIIRPNLGESAKTETLQVIKTRYKYISDRKTAEAFWNNQHLLSLHQCTHFFRWGRCSAVAKNTQCDHGKRSKTLFVLSGALFGIWNLIESVFGDLHIRITRVTSTEGVRKVGIVVNPQLVNFLRSMLQTQAANSLIQKFT